MYHWLLIITMSNGAPLYFGPFESEDACIEDSKQLLPGPGGVRRVCSPRTIMVEPTTGHLYWLGDR